MTRTEKFAKDKLAEIQQRRQWAERDGIEPTSRFELMQLAAIRQDPVLVLDPPATDEEIETFKKAKSEIRKENAKAKAEGRTIAWDIISDI